MASHRTPNPPRAGSSEGSGRASSSRRAAQPSSTPQAASGRLGPPQAASDRLHSTPQGARLRGHASGGTPQGP
eukprot:scaffold34867_cov18-Phaeocystis_antarctica.AAC.1